MSSPPPFIDTHLHFWDLDRHAYPWLDGPGVESLRSTYLPPNWRRDAEGLEVLATVHVQAEMDHALDPAIETAWLAALDPDAARCPSVCVGYADLAAADLDAVLGRHIEHGLFRGVRQEAWFDPLSQRADVPHENLLDDPAWAKGLARLCELDLSFDLLVWARQLDQACDILRRLPELRLVVEHAGLPGPRRDEGLAAWRKGMARIASEIPGAVLKISAMGFIAPDWSVEVVRPVVLEAIDIFGPDRCMFGSNYPVERGASSYPDLWRAYSEITSAFSASERTQMFSGVASRTYRIPLGA